MRRVPVEGLMAELGGAGDFAEWGGVGVGGAGWGAADAAGGAWV